MVGALLAPVPHHAGGALHHLTGLALLVNLAQTGPLTKLHVGVNLDEGDPVLHAEGSHELLVHGLVTVLGQDAEQGLALVQSLGASRSPRARPSAIRACLRTSWMAVLMSMGPLATGAAEGTSPSTSLMLISLMFRQTYLFKSLQKKPH